MSSHYAVDIAESPSRYPRSTAPIPDLKITGAIPVVRRAILAKHDPKLRKRQTRRAGNIMKTLWPTWKDRYLAQMAEIAGVEAGELVIHEREEVRYRLDGETPMVDLPRIRTAERCVYRFDQRNCCALCIDKFSSKIWSRLGPPERHPGYGLDDVRETTERYRRHAIKAAEWFYHEFFRLTADAFEGTKRTRDTAVLEVTTVGLRVEGEVTGAVNDAWLFDGESVNLANDTLCDYLKSAAGIDCSIPELLDAERDDAYWVKVPAVVRQRNGVLASRNVLYLGHVTGDLVQFVGIGIDDSTKGDFANDVALKISRLIAGWI